MAYDKKGNIDWSTMLGIAFLMLGFFTSLIIFLGFMLKESEFLFIGSLIMGIISVLVAIADKVMPR